MRPSLPQLRRLLTPEQRRLLDAAIEQANSAATPLWLVGGAVRDLALGRPVHDLDLALDGDTEAFAATVAQRLAARDGATTSVESEPRFGTASLRGPGGRLDLARLRRETYEAPGALPRVSFDAGIEEDLARRDFSVNAIALGLTGPDARRLVDPFGGLGDLTAHRLRVLHARSFEDDATRLWRGARTAALFDLHPDPETAQQIADGSRWLETISGDRISAEIAFTAARGRSGRTLALAEAWGVLRGTHRALRLVPAAARALRSRPGPHPVGVITALLLAPIEDRERLAVLRRLNASRTIARCVADAAALLAAGDEGDVRPERLAALAGAGAEARTAARWLAPAAQDTLQRALARWERTRPPIDATALMRLGLPAGPSLGAALEELRRARYLGTLKTAAEARAAARRMIAPARDRADARPVTR